MTVDHYAGAAQRWAEGATLVYGPIARELIKVSPHSLRGQVVLDIGAGTGVASAVLAENGANPIAADLSFDMLSWRARERPPSAITDVAGLALRDCSVDGTVAAFVLNHLIEPAAGLAELVRVTRPGGAVLACVYANSSRSEVRDAIDHAAQLEGWEVPGWYREMKAEATPILGTGHDMERMATQAGLVGVTVDERPVDVGITEPEQLVTYRLGQAHYSAWLAHLGPVRAGQIQERLVETIRPIMRPYRPVVVFLSALTP